MIKIKKEDLIKYAKEQAFDYAYDYGTESALTYYEDLTDLYETFSNYRINKETMMENIEMHNQILQLINEEFLKEINKEIADDIEHYGAINEIKRYY